MIFPDFRLEGKTAIITGGNKGIGRAIALGLAEAGADVVVTGRTETELQDVCADVIRMGKRGIPIRMDVRYGEDVQRTVDITLRSFKKIDILVNSAGISELLPIENHSEEVWDRIIETNLKGVFLCCQAVGSHMVRRKCGSIINISSQAGMVGLVNHAAYCASKGGVNLLTKVLALEWAPHNVRVNAVAPTVIRTPMTDKVFADPSLRRELLAKIPLGRFGEPNEVAGAVIYLASDASQMVTGHILALDGGWTAQ